MAELKCEECGHAAYGECANFDPPGPCPGPPKSRRDSPAKPGASGRFAAGQRVRNKLCSVDLGTVLPPQSPEFIQFGDHVRWDKSPTQTFYVSHEQLVAVDDSPLESGASEPPPTELPSEPEPERGTIALKYPRRILASWPPPAEPVAKPASGGAERVSHEDARGYAPLLPLVSSKRLLAYIDQQQAQQEQSELEAKSSAELLADVSELSARLARWVRKNYLFDKGLPEELHELEESLHGRSLGNQGDAYKSPALRRAEQSEREVASLRVIRDKQGAQLNEMGRVIAERDDLRSELTESAKANAELREQLDQVCGVLYNTGATRGDALTRAKRANETYHRLISEQVSLEEERDALKTENEKLRAERNGLMELVVGAWRLQRQR